MKKVSQTVIVANAFYTIANTSGKVVEGAAGETNGGAVQLGVYTHKETQEWAFLRVGEGVYRIKNRGTGKMLDLMMGGSADGTWLHQWEDANCSSQMWIVEPSNDGRVKLHSQLAAGKCVDVVGMSSEAGARLQIWQDVNGENQLWTIREAAEKKPRAAKAEKAVKAPAKKADKPARAAKKAAPKAKPAVKAEAKPAVKAEAKPAVKAEAKPAVKAEAKPAVKAEAKPAVKAEKKAPAGKK